MINEDHPGKLLTSHHEDAWGMELKAFRLLLARDLAGSKQSFDKAVA